jgi:hypothetical protein
MYWKEGYKDCTQTAFYRVRCGTVHPSLNDVGSRENHESNGVGGRIHFE